MPKKWKLLSSNKVFSTKWLSVEKRSYKLPTGKIANDYYLLNRSNYVLIVAVDQYKKIVLTKQYRYSVDDFVYELPAGWMNKNESPSDAAARELLEETGFVCTDIKSATISQSIYAQPGFSSMLCFAVVLQIDSNSKRKQILDDDENIEIELVSIEKINTMIRNGQIKDMGLLAAIAIYDRMDMKKSFSTT